jgi:hypothetical protein
MNMAVSVKVVTKILIAACLVLAVYIAGKMYGDGRDIRPPEGAPAEPAGHGVSFSPDSTGRKSGTDNDAEIFRRRDIFEVPYARDPEREPGAVAPAPAGGGASLADYRLRGVVLDRHPQAIVEDVPRHQTVFVSVGDNLGPGTVNAVLENKILVTIDNKITELIIEPDAPRTSVRPRRPPF